MITISQKSYQSEMHAHSHDHAQWVLPLRGTLDLDIDGQTGKVNHQQGAFIAANATHTFASLQTNQFLVIDMQKQMPLCAKPFWQIDAALCKLLEFIKLQPSHEQDSLTLLAPILTKCLSNRFASPLDLRVKEALMFIQNHSHEPINSMTVAKAVYTSRRMLDKLCQENLGTTISQLIKQTRLHQARALILTTPFCIEQIALSTGFEDCGTFHRNFKKAFGHTPSSLRMNQK